MKKISMLLAAGCAIGLLTGCGIPEEEHNAMIQELNDQHAAEVDKLNTTIAEKDEIITNEKKKVRQNRIELDDNAQRIDGLNQKVAAGEKALAAEKTTVANLESDLKTQKSMTVSAEERATDAENSYNTLNVEYEELKRRFENFRNNMTAMSNPAPAPAAVEEAAAPAAATEYGSDSEKASSLLDEMGNL